MGDGARRAYMLFDGVLRSLADSMGLGSRSLCLSLFRSKPILQPYKGHHN